MDDPRLSRGHSACARPVAAQYGSPKNTGARAIVLERSARLFLTACGAAAALLFVWAATRGVDIDVSSASVWGPIVAA